MPAFSLDRKKLIQAALEKLTPGMERVCVLPAESFVKLTRIVNLVDAQTSVETTSGDVCPSPSVGLDHFNMAIFGNKGALPSAKFVDWVEKLGNPVDRIQTNHTPLTKALLAKYDIIILDWLVRTYSTTEARLLAEWVENGGGLLSMTGYTNNNTVVDRPNSLLQPLGLSYNASHGFFNGPVTSWTHPHPLTEGITSISFKGGVYIDIVNDGIGVNTVIATRPQGPVAVAQERKAGRMFIFGDEWIEFDSEWQQFPQVKQLWSNVVTWLRRKSG